MATKKKKTANANKQQLGKRQQQPDSPQPSHIPTKMRITNNNKFAELSKNMEEVSDAANNMNNMAQNGSDAAQLISGVLNVLNMCKSILEGLQKQESAADIERKRSIVLIGLPESSKTTASERVADDNKQIVTLLDKLGIEATPTTHYRMGKQHDNKRKGPRLVKVIFGASMFMKMTLARWKNNRNEIRSKDNNTDWNWERLLIRPSLTPEERAAEKIKWQQRMENNGQNGMETNMDQAGRISKNMK